MEGQLVYAFSPSLVNFKIGASVWRRYLPEALEQGKFVAKPDPVIIKGGAGQFQGAMDRLKAGVSAQKLVVEW